MSLLSILQYILFLLVVTLLVKPAGSYMARVFQGQKTFLDPVLLPIERLIYRLTKVDQRKEMTWKEYAISFVIFSLVNTLVLYLILRLQTVLPWYDATFQTTPLTPDLSMNTAISFATTTTWQAYGGESTMSYFSQMVGLAGQNFLAAAAGLAIGVAFVRGFARQQTNLLGNFWADLVRAILWVLLPLSLVGSLFLIWQGVPMNFNTYTDVTTLEGTKQTIAQGPVAVLELIKNLGTNGGGFFNANGAHPYENPTPLTNFVEMLAIVVVLASFTYTFRQMVGKARQGWILYWIMVCLFVVGLVVAGVAEQAGNSSFNTSQNINSATGQNVSLSANVNFVPTDTNPGGNMEGKEMRFGIGSTVLTAITTSNGATGSTNAAYDSFTPLGGLVPMLNMQLGEVIFGGLGTGLYSIVEIALVGLFVAGLMVGRTPEYLGKNLIL